VVVRVCALQNKKYQITKYYQKFPQSDPKSIQDAARKRRRRSGSTRPGPWAGSVLRTDLDGVFVLVAQEKWDKAKALIAEVLEMIRNDANKLPRKRLEQIRGFLQYVTRTYTGMNPYLIGFHLTIDGWRDNRDAEGWRLKPRGGGYSEAMAEMREALKMDVEVSDPSAPAFVKAAPRFLSDLEALQRLTMSEAPPLRRVRCSKVGFACYGFYDASGRGFGASFQIQDMVEYEYGQWVTEVSESESSNWKELGNLVIALELKVKEHDLRDCELFIFTDNTTAEAAFWKGSSKSRKLFELVLRLRTLELEADLIIHVIHVSGTRMIEQGTDGLSRADKSTGVMQGVRMEAFVPLHLSAFERSDSLRLWIAAATKDFGTVVLNKNDWFLAGQGLGNFVWCPPPAAADVVVEQLGKARHKRPTSLHIVVVPRLMTGRWRRHLTRECDCYFRIPAGCKLWGKCQHEPVLIFICLPFLVHRPNFSERRRLLENFYGSMFEPAMWQDSGERGGIVLRKFLLRARSLCSL
jgi:hypothetical protein